MVRKIENYTVETALSVHDVITGVPLSPEQAHKDEKGIYKRLGQFNCVEAGKCMVKGALSEGKLTIACYPPVFSNEADAIEREAQCSEHHQAVVDSVLDRGSAYAMLHRE